MWKAPEGAFLLFVEEVLEGESSPWVESVGVQDHLLTEDFEAVSASVACDGAYPAVEAFGLGVGPVHVRVVEIGEDLRGPAFDRPDELVIGPHVGFRTSLLPLREHVPCLRGTPRIRVDVAERLLEQVDVSELGILLQKGVEVAALLDRKILVVPQHEEPVVLEGLPVRRLDPSADARTDGIHRLHEVLDDMEMVDDDRNIGEDLVHGIPVGLPHVHRDELEVLRLLHAPQRADDRLLGAFLREFEDAPLGPVDLHEHAPVIVFEMDLIDAQNRRRDEAVLRHQNVRVVVEDRCDCGDAGVVAVGDGGEGLVQGVPL